MFAYGAFEKQDSKMANCVQIRTPIGSYKTNEERIAATEVSYTYTTAGKYKIWQWRGREKHKYEQWKVRGRHRGGIGRWKAGGDPAVQDGEP